ncbi:MAG TPA: RraA family protein [bacterium]|nr:RraA family protein [bacterium]
MSAPLSPDVLARLRTIPTPAVANGVEVFNVRPRTAGFMSSQVRCMFPDLGAMVGYAFTATCRATEPPPKDADERRFNMWRALERIPAPRIVVVHDLDDPPGVGAYWGEVQSNIHRALGCVGTVTDGSVRDLNEVHTLGFHFFAGSVSVSHAYVHLVDFGMPVEVGGLTVRPGDLLHADQHGVLAIPLEIAPEVVDGVARVERREREIISYCQSSNFTRDGLESLFRGQRDASGGDRR